MNFHSTAANILNGIAGVLGATVAGLSSRFCDLGLLSEITAQVGGVIIVILTITNGLFMARRNWKDRNK
jgi:hypothetical protein